MSTDPYHVVKDEIQSTLQAAESLLSSYRRIRSTAREDSEELNYAKSELKATLSALEADLEDLEDSVRVVEEAGPQRFGLENAELQSRRRYVQQVRRQLEGMRNEVAPSSETSSSSKYPPGYGNGSRRDSQRTDEPPEREDDQSEWSKMEQQMIMQEQDKALDAISGTLSTLQEQAGLMGTEIGEHIEMLGDLEQNVDKSQVKLDSSMKKLQKFLRDIEETKSGWCIAILIVILMILLLLVILL